MRILLDESVPSGSARRLMGHVQRRLVLLLPLFQGCAGTNAPRERVPIPGGMYSWGTAQRASDFANVEVAQSRLLMYSGDPGPWRRIAVTTYASSAVLGLQSYFVLQARWKLKDGREFVLASVDQGALVREYFKSHTLVLPWEREGRRRTVGDASPTLAHDIRNDELRMKWVVKGNRTPVNERLGAGGAANPWILEEEEHVIAVIKGTPTSGIDFAKTYEPRK